LWELLKEKFTAGILTVTGGRQRGDGARPGMSSKGCGNLVLVDEVIQSWRSESKAWNGNRE
jgi:hypothetical protein